MLIRAALALKDNGLQAHLNRRLSGSDVRVESLGGQRAVWRKVLRCGCDVIVISEALIPMSTENGIGMLNELARKSDHHRDPGQRFGRGPRPAYGCRGGCGALRRYFQKEHGGSH